MSQIFRCLTLFLATCGLIVYAQPAKKAFEISDYYRTVFPGAPSLSPDGSKVVFAVQRYDLPKGKGWSEIWMMNSDGSELRQMTFGQHQDTSPVFAPDGRRFVFSRRVNEKPQLHLMRIDGGEAKRLTNFSMGVTDPVWSPNGKWIAVTAEVFPECGADSDCNEKIRKTWEEGKLKAHMADELLYRHWTSWADGKVSHVLLVDAESGQVVRDLTPGRWNSPIFSLGGDRGYDFSPDSKELCFVSNREADQASTTNADLWITPIEGEIDEHTAVNITEANNGWDGSPLYSPDGRYIAYRSQATPAYESDLFRIAVYDRQSKSVRYLTDRQNFDNWVDEIAWSPDSKTIFFQAEVQARTPLLKIDIQSGAISKVLTDATITAWELSSDGRTIVYGRRSIAEPPEIFLASSDGGRRRRQLTEFNMELRREVDIRPAEEMWFQGAGNYKVHTFVIKPHDFDPAKKYPLILNVHGGPQQQWLDSYRGDWQVYPGKGYVVAFANPTGSSGYGQDYVDAIACDWGGRVFEDLMKVTDGLEALPYVDSSRMGAMGWSYGGYMMMWFAGHTDRFKTLAAMMGVYNLTAMFGSTEELWFVEKDLCGQPWNSEAYRKWSPSEYVEKFKTPTLVITGELDYRVPYTQSLEFFTALQKMKVPSRLVVFPNAGHWPSWYEMAFYYDVHLDWFHRWLGGGKPPWDPEKFLRNQVFKSEK
ncbi:MAG TPA: S9 family peptidase [Acidobacteriota bacterium]|nr:S9 family peptidase [Acidobacteriota bacterium]